MKSKLILVVSLFAAISCGRRDVETIRVEAQKIIDNIEAPTFRDVDYYVDAPADGVTDVREAIQAAIDLCSYENGGRVILRPGKYFSKGPIVLKSDVNLHLEEGAEILFSPDPADYLPGMITIWEGTELINYCSPIYAYHCENIAITGKGILNGQASKGAFSTMKHQHSEQQLALRTMAWNKVPVQERDFGAGSTLPPAMLQPWGCTKVLLEDFHLTDSPFWCIHPVFCDNVIVRGVSIDSQNLNNDGCDPESTSNVLIENCNFNSYDDAVAIKAGRDKEGWKTGRKSRNIVIRNNYFDSGSAVVCIGSEMAAGVENVYIYNIKAPACKTGLSLRGSRDRGGFIRNVYLEGMQVDSVASALIRLNDRYWEQMGGKKTPIFENITVRNCSAVKSDAGAIAITGREDKPISNVLLENVVVEQCPIPLVLEDAENVRFVNVSVNGTILEETPQPTVGVELPPAKMRVRK